MKFHFDDSWCLACCLVCRRCYFVVCVPALEILGREAWGLVGIVANVRGCYCWRAAFVSYTSVYRLYGFRLWSLVTTWAGCLFWRGFRDLHDLILLSILGGALQCAVLRTVLKVVGLAFVRFHSRYCLVISFSLMYSSYCCYVTTLISWLPLLWTSPLSVSAVGPAWRNSSWYHFATDPCCVFHLEHYYGHDCRLFWYVVVLCVHHFCRRFSFRYFYRGWTLGFSLCLNPWVEGSFIRFRHAVSCSLHKSPSHILLCYGSFHLFNYFTWLALPCRVWCVAVDRFTRLGFVGSGSVQLCVRQHPFLSIHDLNVGCLFLGFGRYEGVFETLFLFLSLMLPPFVVLWFSLTATPCFVSFSSFIGLYLTGEVKFAVVLGFRPTWPFSILSATVLWLLLFLFFSTTSSSTVSLVLVNCFGCSSTRAVYSLSMPQFGGTL